MVTLTVLRTFYDLKKHRDRVPGEEFTVSEERAEQIVSALPGYVTVHEPEPEPEHEPESEPEEVDLSKMTVAQLSALARERGVMPKGRPSKVRLIEILSKE